MPNELILIISLLLINSAVVLLFRLFGQQGLFLWTAIATISANIEVLLIVNAFGMEQTLGNLLFASTFLVTDICSELYGKESAKKAVYMGIVTSIAFIVISQSWMLYTVSSADWAMPHIQAIFSNTPRVMLAGIIVYVIVQLFDVAAYHWWWALTKKLTGDSKKFLWIRNNGSTLISQLMNTVLFTWAAFYGTYEAPTLISIALSSYVIFIVTSVADTPFVYLARKIGSQTESSERA